MNNNKYYDKDFRTFMMLLAVLQLFGMILVPIAIVLAFFMWKVAIVVGVIGVLFAWKFGDLNIELGHKWSIFSGEKEIESVVLYGDIERPETAEKFRFVAEDVGGLYQEGNEIILGSLNGEVRCKFNELQFEVVNKSALVNYINISLGDEVFSFFPKWDGSPSTQPNSPEKSDWGASVIQELVSNAKSGAVAA
ncbi:hypothetical protein [Colwellia asteriadis]